MREANGSHVASRINVSIDNDSSIENHMSLIVCGDSHTHIRVTWIIIDSVGIHARSVHTMIVAVAACKDISMDCATQSLNIRGSMNILVMRVGDAE